MLPLPLESGCGQHGKLKPAFNSLPGVAPETIGALCDNSQRLPVINYCRKELYGTSSTVSIFDKFSAAFSTYWINIGSIQSTYQIYLFLTLETKRIDPMCISDRAWYDMYQIHLGVEQ